MSQRIKFAHMSDCHLGAWNAHPDLRELPPKAFAAAIGECIQEAVDFIIIAGDLFDTSFPPVDILQRCAAALRKAKEAGIRVYYVAGSHDYSPTGKSMLGVLEEAGLMANVAKGDENNGSLLLQPTVDATGAKLYGIFGRRGSLDVRQFEAIDKSIEQADGFKIFVMHCAVLEYKPPHFETMLAVPLGALPRNFNYYASGHVHVNFFDAQHKLAFPGPLFPAGMDELESYDSGFYIAEYNGNALNVRRKHVKLYDVVAIKISADGKSAEQVERELMKAVECMDASGKIVIVKIKGTLESGKPSDINYRLATEKTLAGGAFCVKYSKNVLAKDAVYAIDAGLTAEQIEKKIIGEHAEKLRLDGIDAVTALPQLMTALAEEKKEGETNAAYEARIKVSAKRILELD